MNEEFEKTVEEYLASIDADNSKTNETKATIREHIVKFSQYVEAKANAPKAAPVEEAAA